MQSDNIQSIQINKEKRNISKYVGLVFGRIVLLAGLFILFFFLLPISVYLFAYFLLFPWIFSNILASRSKEISPLFLDSCAKKYFFTPSRYRAEKFTGKAIIFFLIIWQISLNRTLSYPVIIQIAPAIILLIYLLSRMICTMTIRKKIHRYYMNFLNL